MRTLLARGLFVATLALLAFGVRLSSSPSSLVPDATTPAPVVYLAGAVPPEGLPSLVAAVAAEDGALLLFDPGNDFQPTRAFLEAIGARQVIAVGAFPDGAATSAERLGVSVRRMLPWDDGPSREDWHRLRSRAREVVICPPEPRGQLLQAACLAGVRQAPLVVTRAQPNESQRLATLLDGWGTRHVYLIGEARCRADDLADWPLTCLANEQAVADLHRRSLGGAVTTLVVANPFDADRGRQSDHAVWVAVRKRAPLVLTGTTGDAAAAVRAAVRRRGLAEAENLVIVAGLNAIPMEQRPNPIPADKDPFIEMEPLTPTGTEPFSYATGRLFHDASWGVPLVLARERLLAQARGPRRAVVASNATENMPLLETFSRNTARELANAGYETTLLLGPQVSRAGLQSGLAGADIFLYEGHHNRLICDFDFHHWEEPLPPALVFLQSCLALKEAKAQHLLTRGAVAVVGSSTRTYSASGGACSLSYFDALLYEGQSLGGSLRHAKNFLLAYALLKEKRLGKEAAARSGANLRSAWAFTLWGDPTLELPRPAPPESALPPVRHQVRDGGIVLEVPAQRHPRISGAKYYVDMPANARLAGLLRKGRDEEGAPLVPFLFAEVRLPRDHPADARPVLHSHLSSSSWVFLWDDRRHCGYLLVTSSERSGHSLRFRVEWQSDGLAEQPAGPPAGSRGSVGATDLLSCLAASLRRALQPQRSPEARG